MSATVHLLGLGVSPRDHASVEVLAAAGACRKILASGLAEPDRKFLAEFAPKGALVAAPEPKAAVAALLAEAKAGRDCALVTPGHPFYFSALGGAVVAACEAAGVAWKSYGAVSPMGVGLRPSAPPSGPPSTACSPSNTPRSPERKYRPTRCGRSSFISTSP